MAQQEIKNTLAFLNNRLKQLYSQPQNHITSGKINAIIKEIAYLQKQLKQ